MEEYSVIELTSLSAERQFQKTGIPMTGEEWCREQNKIKDNMPFTLLSTQVCDMGDRTSGSVNVSYKESDFKVNIYLYKGKY